MKQTNTLLTTLFTTIILLINPTAFQQQKPVLAQSLSYESIEQFQAATTTTTTFVYPGQITTIDFSATDQIITYINLSDNSRTTYTTDSPLNNGQTQTVFLKQIKPLDFPGATKSPTPNLVIKTISKKTGKSQIYNFQIVHRTGRPTYLGIKITTQSKTTNNQVVNIGQGKTASIDDVERGLRIAIIRGYTRRDDPIVRRIRNFIALAQNENIPISEAAAKAEVPFTVIIELGKIGLEPVIQKPINLSDYRSD